MKKLTWFEKTFCNYKKIKGISIKMFGVGKSGNDVISSTYNFLPQTISEIGSVIDYNYSELSNILYKKYEKQFKEISKMKLKKWRKTKFIELHAGWCISGKHIIKIYYDLVFDLEDIK